MNTSMTDQERFLQDKLISAIYNVCKLYISRTDSIKQYNLLFGTDSTVSDYKSLSKIGWRLLKDIERSHIGIIEEDSLK